MKIFVTGGAGYVGSVTVEYLLEKGFEVYVLDDLSTGHVKAVHPQAKFFKSSLSDRHTLREILNDIKPEGIIHFASRSLVGESMNSPFKYLGENITNGLNLLEIATDLGIQKFILSSSANLFSDPQKIPIDEQEAIVPGSPYGESKAILERILFWLGKTKQLNFACLRYFNACGATERFGEMHDPETHLIPLILKVALGQRQSIAIYGNDYPTPDGTCIRDYVHVWDLAQAHYLALQNRDIKMGYYNIGIGKGFSVQEVINCARKITEHPIPTFMAPRRSGDPATLIADGSEARKELGWKPQYLSLEGILESAWKWHQKYPEGYGS